MIENLAYTRSSVKHNKSIFYYVSFGFIIIIYFILFNANSMLPDNSTVMNSALGKEVNAGSTKLSINRWEYNENKKFMEIELSYKDSGDYIVTKLNFSAKAKVDVKKQLAVKTMLNTANIYIVRIENIPENYEAIALKVSQNASSDSTINIDTSNINTNDFSSSITSNNMSNTDSDEIKNNATTLYCDYRKVKINNNIISDTQIYYLINITKTEINNINKNVITINNKVKSNENLIIMANEKINSLNSQYKYEIKEEQSSTNQKINSYKAKIADNQQQNVNLQKTKSLLVEKIKKLDQKVSDLEKVKNNASIKEDTKDIKTDNVLAQIQKEKQKQFSQDKIKRDAQIKGYKDSYELLLGDLDRGRLTGKSEKDNDIKPVMDTKYIKTDNILLQIQKKQQEQLNQKKIEQDAQIKEYKDSYELLLGDLDKGRLTEKPEKDNVVPQINKKLK